MRVLTETKTITDDDILDPPRIVAEALGVHPGTLARMRLQGRGPDFVQLSHRNVGYPRSAWRAWLRSRTFRSTSEAHRALDEHAGTNPHR
jgi:hypothetical protein